MARKRIIVVVEDEEPIRRGITDALRMAGYDVVEAADGEVGLIEARRAGVDLVLLDLLLPKLNGFDVLAELRVTRPALPVVILTARGSEDDRVRGLRGGADDYVVKPFSARELLARVEAVLRRSPERPAPVVRIVGGDAVVDCARREIRKGENEAVVLSEMEANILERLAAHPGRAVSREELLSCVWGIRDGSVETRAIDMHITRLRQKLAAASDDNVEWIATVRGKGYMIGASLEVKTAEGQA
ncbi:MAG: response regulator transcription factor [Phycisphaerales bacterium]|nr:MAG: response regulator transcription factor [Phycisphaerales bacterium]